MSTENRGRKRLLHMHGGAVVAALFFIAAIALNGTLPLWLDEIIQLRETRNTTPAHLMASLPGQPGAAPLGYLTQQKALRFTGYSVRWARFPSAVFMAGSVFLVGLLAGELQVGKPWIGSTVFAVLPSTLRYADESRVYSQALFLSLLSTFLFVWLMKRETWPRAIGYGLALTAAIYTQPFTIFVGCAHIFRKARWKARVRTVAAVSVAVAAFLPWYFHTKLDWSSGIAGAGLHFALSAKTPLMLFREMAGAGYWGSGLLLILCVMAGFRRGQKFLLLLIGVPIVLAIAADARFGYFVATRQILWVLPAVAILAAQAFDRKPRLALPVTLLLVIICFWQSYRYFRTPRENWEVAANALAGEVARGSCLVVAPKEQLLSYEFFRPELAGRSCPGSNRAVAAMTPYATDAQRDNSLSTLTAQGYSRQREYEAGKSRMVLFSR